MSEPTLIELLEHAAEICSTDQDAALYRAAAARLWEEMDGLAHYGGLAGTMRRILERINNGPHTPETPR